MEVSANARAIYGSVAKQKGFELPQEAQATVLRQLDGAIRYNDGEVYLVDRNGNRASTVNADGKVVDLGFDEFIADLVKALPPPPAKDQPKPEARSAKPINLTQKMRTMLEERKSDAAKLATSIVGNPWSRDSLNLTQQMLIARADPERAKRLKASAGVG